MAWWSPAGTDSTVTSPVIPSIPVICRSPAPTLCSTIRRRTVVPTCWSPKPRSASTYRLGPVGTVNSQADRP